MMIFRIMGFGSTTLLFTAAAYFAPLREVHHESQSMNPGCEDGCTLALRYDGASRPYVISFTATGTTTDGICNGSWPNCDVQMGCIMDTVRFTVTPTDPAALEAVIYTGTQWTSLTATPSAIEGKFSWTVGGDDEYPGYESPCGTWYNAIDTGTQGQSSALECKGCGQS